MTNAQEWLNSKFPTRQNKNSVKILRIFGDRPTGNSYQTSEDRGFGTPETSSLSGELVIKDFPRLEWITMTTISNIARVSLVNCPQIQKLNCYKMSGLREVKGLEELPNLVYLTLEECPRLQKPYTFLVEWKQEIEQLKAQLVEYESDTASQTSTESSYSDLEAKIRQKELQLNNVRDGSRRSTAPLRKEIELLKKLLGAENKIKTLETKEAEYQQQLNQKSQEITNKQQQINALQSQVQAKTLSENQARTRIGQLEQQIQNLNQEKQALQERMLSERQEALAEWEREKGELNSALTRLQEQKETYQKSADYLRETLKTTEKTLEEIKQELEAEKAKNQELTKIQETLQESHSQELKNRSEVYGVVQERNSELEKKLSGANLEISKLGEWIGKLESLSGEGNALGELRRELESAQSQVIALQEELSSKKPKSYWWIYAVIALVAVYFLMG